MKTFTVECKFEVLTGCNRQCRLLPLHFYIADSRVREQFTFCNFKTLGIYHEIAQQNMGSLTAGTVYPSCLYPCI